MAAMMIEYNARNKVVQSIVNLITNSGLFKYSIVDAKKGKQTKVNKGYTYDVVPPKLQKELDEARADYKAGRYRIFANAKEAVKYLDSL
jgi:hypothetical protein